jgi:hypothetical protein
MPNEPMTGSLVPHAVTATIFWGMLLAAAVTYSYEPSGHESGWAGQTVGWERARTKLARGGRPTKIGIDGTRVPRGLTGTIAAKAPLAGALVP